MRQGTGVLAAEFRALLDQQLDQPVLDPGADAPDGADNGFTQLRAIHRADHDLAGLERGGQSRLCERLGVEVGAHPDHDADASGHRLLGRGGQQGVDERGAILGRGALSEQLLELVHYQMVYWRIRRVRHRMGKCGGGIPAGYAQSEVPVGAQSGDQPGPQHRGLTCSGCPDHDQRQASPALLCGPVEEQCGQLGSAEEPRRVLRLETGQAAVGLLLLRHLPARQAADAPGGLVPGTQLVLAVHAEDPQQLGELGDEQLGCGQVRAGEIAACRRVGETARGGGVADSQPGLLAQRSERGAELRLGDDLPELFDPARRRRIRLIDLCHDWTLPSPADRVELTPRHNASRVGWDSGHCDESESRGTGHL